MSKDKPHGFCETPHENCTMNYCDENGCMNRKRNLVGDPIEMSNNKQSSVEWLFEQIKNHIDAEDGSMGMNWLHDGTFEQAKEIHKGEQINTFKHAQVLIKMDDTKRAEQYYNETYGGNNEQQ